MEYMDVDQVLDVPDTPDRVPVQNINARNCIKRENNSTVTNHSGTKDFSVKGFRNPPTDRRFLFRSSKNLSISDKSERHDRATVSALRSSSSSKNALPLKRMVGDKTAIHETKHFIQPQRMEKGKGVCTTHSQSQSAARQEDSSRADLRKQNGHAQVPKKAAPCGTLGNSRAEESRKRSVSANIISSIPGAVHSSSASSNVCKVKVNVDDTCKVGSSFDHGKGIDLVVDSQPEAGKTVSASLHPNTSRRVSGQKRLVRNGCISPLNIAKVKQSAEMPNNSPVCAGQDDIGTVASDGRLGQIDIRDLITEPNDSHRHKGKAVINPLSSKGPEGMPHRSSQTSNEKTDGTSNSSGFAYKSIEGLGGWRSTRNRTKNVNLRSSDEDLYRSGGNNNHENGAVRRDYRNESSASNHNNYPNQVSTSSTHGGNNDRVSAPPFEQAVSNLRSQSGQFSEHQHANARIKRQKQASTSSTHGECSTSTFDDSELVCLGSSGEPSNLRSTRDRNRNGLASLNPVIEIDEFSPEIRNNSSHNIGCSSNDDTDVRARQLEADEMLARELQEELYNEVPGVGVGEIDADIALALQQQESSQRAISSRSHVVRPRGSLISNLRRQSHPSLRRGTQARVPTSARMARLRGSFPGQPRTISSSGGAPLFPPNMDLDMRMHILETLEAFSDMGMPGGALQVQRDFNENDYEMLLALDENNHQHGGASLAQINGLPQSTVQSDNHQEDCAICLDTPTIGDTIRHLPCLHRFHKDCIDPWLRRKTSCPVCKSSIT